MRDDLTKLPLPKSAKKYARMTSKDLGSDWSKKTDMYMDMAADLTNQSKEGFKNKDASGKVKHAFKESAEMIVARLLEGDEPHTIPAALRAGKDYFCPTVSPTLKVKFNVTPRPKGSGRSGWSKNRKLPSMRESIRAAAVKCHDGTVIAGPPGADHIACCMMANQQGKSWDDEGLGFVTDDDRFVDRNEAEMIGMKHGQLRPEISDPGMVHAKDFYWNESRGGYRYETCCVNADGNDITDMVDSAVDVTYEEFMRNVPLDQIFASGIGYGYDWPPAKLIVAGIDPHEVGRQGLTLKKDWHVSYHKSTYQGRPCYFMCHSAIEYVFVKD